MYPTDITAAIVMGLVIYTADTGERAGELLVFEKFKNQYSRLVKILADQGFAGVEFYFKFNTGGSYSSAWKRHFLGNS